MYGMYGTLMDHGQTIIKLVPIVRQQKLKAL